MRRSLSNATSVMFTVTLLKDALSLQTHRNQQISQLPKIQSSRRLLIGVILPSERSLKRLSTRFLLRIILLLQILQGQKTKTVLQYSKKKKHKNLKLQLSRIRATLAPLAPWMFLNKLLQNKLLQKLLLQVQRKIPEL